MVRILAQLNERVIISHLDRVDAVAMLRPNFTVRVLHGVYEDFGVLLRILCCLVLGIFVLVECLGA